jgi:hypothetical protein
VRKQIIWSLVAGLLLLHLSVMTVLFSWRNPVLELLELWVGLTGLISFLYGVAAASEMEIRLGRFQYQGRKAVLISLGRVWRIGNAYNYRYTSSDSLVLE